MALKAGEKIIISGLRFGKRFAHGFTTRCKPGNETPLQIVGELKGQEILPAICEPRAKGAKSGG